MNRITKADIHSAFARAVPADQRATDFGKGGTNAHNIGKHALDFNSVYGGWVIITFSGGDSGDGYCHGANRFGSSRRSSHEMLAFLQGIAAGREVSEMTDLPVTELLRAGGAAFKPADVTHRDYCALTGGPAWSILNLTTGHTLNVALDPAFGTYTVWCRTARWSGVTPDRLREAVAYMRGTWADTWEMAS